MTRLQRVVLHGCELLFVVFFSDYFGCVILFSFLFSASKCAVPGALLGHLRPNVARDVKRAKHHFIGRVKPLAYFFFGSLEQRAY